MRVLKKSELIWVSLPGRAIQSVVGKLALIESTGITMGFARFSDEYGSPQPHQHGEETVFILSTKKGWVRYGLDRDNLSQPISLENGMILHIPEMEWHLFGNEPGGHIEVIFFYGQVNNIRPEQ
jgi:hypothetical protein